MPASKGCTFEVQFGGRNKMQTLGRTGKLEDVP